MIALRKYYLSLEFNLINILCGKQLGKKQSIQFEIEFWNREQRKSIESGMRLM